MTKDEICRKIRRETGLDTVAIQAVYDRIFETLAGELAKGRTVQVRGFGCFSIKRIAPRKTFNPTTKEMQAYPERKSIGFDPAAALRLLVDPTNPNAEMRKLQKENSNDA